MVKYLNLLLSFFPRPLPLGKSDFYTWSDRIIDLSGEFADRDSMRFALASNLLHLGPQVAYKPDQYFIKSMKKAAANQVASYVFQEIKLNQQKAAEEAAAKQKLEDNLSLESTNVQEQQQKG